MKCTQMTQPLYAFWLAPDGHTMEIVGCGYRLLEREQIPISAMYNHVLDHKTGSSR